MTDPEYKTLVKRELSDRAKSLARSRGQIIPSRIGAWPNKNKTYSVYSLDGVYIHYSVEDRCLRVFYEKQQILSCKGDAYSFDQYPTQLDSLLRALTILRKEMLLDDLSSIH